ncbi:MAG: thioesterase [Alphaproteobacteria bacterium]|nr:thioesterase [Alphaproteobacteria bacterium]
MQKYVERKFLKTYQMDRHGLLRPVMLMNELQAIADTHAEKLGVGRVYCEKHDCAWVSTHYLLEILEMPTEKREIEILTWPSSRDALRSSRDFLIRDAETGKDLVRATSQWVMIDAAARRLMRLENVLVGWELGLDRALDRPFEKFSDFVPESSTTIYPRFDDVDVNQHINNAVYAIWATEALGFEFRDTHKLRALDINFKKEIHPGLDQIAVVSKLCGMKSQHMIKSGDTEHANIVCEWEKLGKA